MSVDALCRRIAAKINERTRRPWYDLMRPHLFNNPRDPAPVRKPQDLLAALQKFHVTLTASEVELLWNAFPLRVTPVPASPFQAQLEQKETADAIQNDQEETAFDYKNFIYKMFPMEANHSTLIPDGEEYLLDPFSKKKRQVPATTTNEATEPIHSTHLLAPHYPVVSTVTLNPYNYHPSQVWPPNSSAPPSSILAQAAANTLRPASSSQHAYQQQQQQLQQQQQAYANAAQEQAYTAQMLQNAAYAQQQQQQQQQQAYAQSIQQQQQQQQQQQLSTQRKTKKAISNAPSLATSMRSHRPSATSASALAKAAGEVKVIPRPAIYQPYPKQELHSAVRALAMHGGGTTQGYGGPVGVQRGLPYSYPRS